MSVDGGMDCSQSRNSLAESSLYAVCSGCGVSLLYFRGTSTGRWQFASNLFVVLSQVGKAFGGSWYFSLIHLIMG